MSSIILEQISLINRINNACNVFDKEKENMDVSSCKVRKTALESIWVKFESNHYSLFNHVDYPDLVKTQPYFKDNIFDSIEQTYLTLLGQVQSFIDSHPPPPAHVVLDSTIENSGSLHLRQPFTEDTERLPRINLPEFNGDYKNWESFRDIFTTSVINRANIANVTKLRYLRSCLKGDAENLVKSYSLTDENFGVVWDRLKNRYENKKRLVNAHISAIYSLKPIHKANSFEL